MIIWRLIKGLLKLVATLVVVVAIVAAIAIAGIETQCRPTATADARPAPLVGDDGYARTEANTYWTFPEWYIVYSYEDLGAFLDQQPPSAFPWVHQVFGYWQSVCGINRVAAALPGDHFEYKQMIYVIGVSYTAEFAIKGLYEMTIGRLAEWLRGPVPAATDIFERDVTQAYAAFLRQVPWYEFPFMAKLSALWRDTPLVGDSPVRNPERHLALSAEYLVKAGYARLIGAALAATSAPADLEIGFVASPDVVTRVAAEPGMRVVRTLPDGNVLLVAPRYRAFTELVQRLAAAGVDIVEIAGNRMILMTAIVRDGPIPTVPGVDELFSMPLDARLGFRRVAYQVDVAHLADALRGFEGAGVDVEHLYDY